MKLLTLIVHSELQHELTTLLKRLDSITGYTFVHPEGDEEAISYDEYREDRDKLFGYTARMRAELLLEDEDLQLVMSELSDRERYMIEQGECWITSVEKELRL